MLPKMAEAMGSASDEDTRRTSLGNPSTNAALRPLDVYGLISMVLRASTKESTVAFVECIERELVRWRARKDARRVSLIRSRVKNSPSTSQLEKENDT